MLAARVVVAYPAPPDSAPGQGVAPGAQTWWNMVMNECERYLFDLNGYLVVRSVLTAADIGNVRAEVRAAGVDQVLASHRYVHAGFPPDYYDHGPAEESGYKYLRDSYLLDWGPAIRSLVAHPRLIPYLQALIGSSFRLDHAYGVFARGKTASHALHNGGTPFDPVQAYNVHDGRMHNSMVVVEFALTDVGERDGGFCCIPGSHKSNFPLPSEFHKLDELDATCRSCVTYVAMAAGDALIFTEAVTHGAFGWAGKADRMALLYKYCHGGMQWEKKSPFVSSGHAWDDRQTRVLGPPYVGGRPAS